MRYDDIRDDPLAPWNAVGLVIPWVAAQLRQYEEPELDRTLEAIGQAEVGEDGSYYLQLAIRPRKHPIKIAEHVHNWVQPPQAARGLYFCECGQWYVE